MYLPEQFEHPVHAAAIMREHPFASLVTTDEEGFPFVTHLPLRLKEEHGRQVLLGHCARANPLWRYLEHRPQALARFMGPQAYLSPQVYPDRERVPTWCYLAVHARVEIRLLAGEAAKDALLKELIADHEPAYATQWRELSPAYTRRMLEAIAAFELVILGLQCAVKLNQHRPEAFTSMHAAWKSGGAQEPALATWMERLGLVQGNSG